MSGCRYTARMGWHSRSRARAPRMAALMALEMPVACLADPTCWACQGHNLFSLEALLAHSAWRRPGRPSACLAAGCCQVNIGAALGSPMLQAQRAVGDRWPSLRPWISLGEQPPMPPTGSQRRRRITCELWSVHVRCTWPLPTACLLPAEVQL